MSAHARRSAGPAHRIRANWEEFKSARAGTRFQARFRRRQRQGHKPVTKFFYIVTGFVVLMMGLVLIPAPGPGFLVVLPGAALIAEESYFAARLFDTIELKARRIGRAAVRTWKHAPPLLKAALAALALVAAVAAAFAAYEAFLA
jgi:uncharacterized protein (TIGR02611 family)